MESAGAQELLGSIGRVSRVARRARHGYWFPLLLFGLIILATLPLYKPPAEPASGKIFSDRLTVSLGYYDASHPWGVALFWITAVPLGYIATATYYRLRARRTGIQGRIWPYVVGGLVLFTLLVMTTPGISQVFHVPGFLTHWRRYVPNLFIRGLTPILVIALGFFVLARVERSWVMGGIASVFLAIALGANLYNMSNLFQRLDWIVPDWSANIACSGGFLVFVGLVTRFALQRASD
jgi:hypothetical protein